MLLRYSFPSLNSLILSSCGLNSQDLCSLAQASVEGRLPKLTHLDISKSPDVNLNSLFSDSRTWNQLLSFIVLGSEPPSRIDFFSQRAETDCLRSLQELSFSVLQGESLATTTFWSSLHTIHVSVTKLTEQLIQLS